MPFEYKRRHSAADITSEPVYASINKSATNRINFRNLENAKETDINGGSGGIGGKDSISQAVPAQPPAIPPIRSSSLMNSPAVESTGLFTDLVTPPSSISAGLSDAVKPRSSGKDYIMYDSDIYAEVYSEALDPPNGFDKQTTG